MSPVLTGDEVISAVLASHAVHFPTHAALAYIFPRGGADFTAVEANKQVIRAQPVG